jgi:serine/threonine protein kinase
MSALSDVAIQIGPRRMLVNIDYAHHELVETLCDIESILLEQTGLMVKNQRKIKVVRMPLTVNGETLDCHIKQYKTFSFRKRLEYMVAPSKATRAWRGAKRLLAKGIATAEPVAALETKRFGLSAESYYISRTIPGASVSVNYFMETFSPATAGVGVVRRAFVRAMANAFRRLHESDIYHSDLKDYNILVSVEKEPPDWKFWFLDVDCVSRFRGMTTRRKIKNLAQLNRTLGKRMKLTDKMAFFKEYFALGHKEKLLPAHKRLIRHVFQWSNS